LCSILPGTSRRFGKVFFAEIFTGWPILADQRIFFPKNQPFLHLLLFVFFNPNLSPLQHGTQISLEPRKFNRADILNLFRKQLIEKLMKYLFTLTICLFAIGSFAQQKQNQYILIIRSKAETVKEASPDAIKTNIMHWTAWMTDLGKTGKIAGGYRPANDGVTINGTDKTAFQSPYIANGEVVTSFLIINAADMDEAKLIAAKCPVFELQGNVEIRPIQNTAN
jgi:hypothetical protein